MKFIYPMVILIIALSAQAARQHDQRPDSVADVFQAENIEGTFVAAPLAGRDLIVHNVERSSTRFSPASTFKILNTLIALDTSVVSSRNSKFKWDGTKHGLTAWNKDQTLQSAFKVSCVWCYQEIARQVGNDHYRTALADADYGNQEIGDQVDQFWLNGTLKISALEQIDFLARLLNGSTAFSDAHVDVLKSIMLEDESLGDYRIYGKTGWTGSDLAVGWYVGYVQKDTEIWVFAMNMRMETAEQAPLRKSLAVQSLQALGLS